ncbi:MAG: radical SAM protein [Candidatus Shapirobacteria bacterium]
MSANRCIEYVLRPEDFGALVYDIGGNTIQRLTGSTAEYRLTHLNDNEIVRGENNPSIGGASFRSPEKVYVDITKRCNMFCDHCLSESGSHGTDSLSLETMNDVGNQMVDMGIFRTKLGGGEPTLHPDFMEIVSNLRQRLLGVSMSTNGLLVANNRYLSQFLAEKGVRVSVSLDGGEEVHNQIRKHPLAYKSAIRAIERLKEEGAVVAIGSTLSRQNLLELPKIVEVATALEVPVKFKRVKPLGRAVSNGLLITPQTPGYAEAVKIISESKWSRPEVMLDLNACSLNGDDIDPDHNSCGVATRSMGINPKGQYSPCFFLGDHFLDGNVHTQSISDIWKNGRAFLEVRESLSQGIAECDVCQRRNTCHGECRAVALHINGSLNAVDPGCPLKN